MKGGVETSISNETFRGKSANRTLGSGRVAWLELRVDARGRGGTGVVRDRLLGGGVPIYAGVCTSISSSELSPVTIACE